jgi:probable phosphoglycerate mutase
MGSLQIALVRHAPTRWNAEGRAQGQTDPPLSDEGRAALVTWRLPEDLARLARAGRLGWVASPLARAGETARGLGAPALRLEPRLVERDWGAWTGRLHAEIEADAPDLGWEGRPPDGESARDVLARARAWLDDLAAEGAAETWLVVTHRGVIRALVAAAVGWDLREPAPLRLLPERLHRVRRRGDGHLQLLTLNEPLGPA